MDPEFCSSFTMEFVNLRHGIWSLGNLCFHSPTHFQPRWSLSFGIYWQVPSVGPQCSQRPKGPPACWNGMPRLSSPPSMQPLSTTEASWYHLFSFMRLCCHSNPWGPIPRPQSHCKAQPGKEVCCCCGRRPTVTWPASEAPGSPLGDLTLPLKRQYMESRAHNLTPSLFKGNGGSETRGDLLQVTGSLRGRVAIGTPVSWLLLFGNPASVGCTEAALMRHQRASAYPLLPRCWMGKSAHVSWQGHAEPRPALSRGVFRVWLWWRWLSSSPMWSGSPTWSGEQLTTRTTRLVRQPRQENPRGAPPVSREEWAHDWRHFSSPRQPVQPTLPALLLHCPAPLVSSPASS